MEPRGVIVIIKNIRTPAARHTPADCTQTIDMLTPQSHVLAGIVQFLNEHRVVLACTSGRLVAVV